MVACIIENVCYRSNEQLNFNKMYVAVRKMQVIYTKLENKIKLFICTYKTVMCEIFINN